jgi:isoleucyl-tRNA synthetase
LKELESLEAKGGLSPEEQLRKQEVASQLVGNSLDARVSLTATGDLEKLLKANAAELTELLIVSQVGLRAGQGSDGVLSVEVSPAAGERCARCWCYTESRGTNPAHPELCPKCTQAVLTDYPGLT